MDYYEMKFRGSGQSLRICWYVFIVSLLLLLVASVTGCKSVKVVEVEKVHNVHHWHTDSVIQKDSTHHETQTTIMQLDSAEMARYGIQLKTAERAWLVKTNELEYQIQQLKALSAQKDSVHDSIPVPYPVEKLVEKQLSWWQGLLIRLGICFVVLIIGIVSWWIIKWKLGK